jgi:hypothetical protein
MRCGWRRATCTDRWLVWWLSRGARLLAALPGVRPGGRITFFCGARRKSPKKRPRTAYQRDAASSGAREQPEALRADASRFALAAVLVTTTIHRTACSLNAGCTPGSRATQRQRRSGDAFVCRSGAHRVREGQAIAKRVRHRDVAGTPGCVVDTGARMAVVLGAQ